MGRWAYVSFDASQGPDTECGVLYALSLRCRLCCVAVQLLKDDNAGAVQFVLVVQVFRMQLPIVLVQTSYWRCCLRSIAFFALT